MKTIEKILVAGTLAGMITFCIGNITNNKRVEHVGDGIAIVGATSYFITSRYNSHRNQNYH